MTRAAPRHVSRDISPRLLRDVPRVTASRLLFFSGQTHRRHCTTEPIRHHRWDGELFRVGIRRWRRNETIPFDFRQDRCRLSPHQLFCTRREHSRSGKQSSLGRRGLHVRKRPMMASIDELRHRFAVRQKESWLYDSPRSFFNRSFAFSFFGSSLSDFS